jgi:hypothetical protein
LKANSPKKPGQTLDDFYHGAVLHASTHHKKTFNDAIAYILMKSPPPKTFRNGCQRFLTSGAIRDPQTSVIAFMKEGSDAL